MFEWDEKKRKQNIAKHGLDFVLVEDLDWEHSIRIEDLRQEYGETRYTMLSYIGNRLYVCIYTKRDENYRIISLRKANPREEKLYEEETYNQ